MWTRSSGIARRRPTCRRAAPTRSSAISRQPETYAAVAAAADGAIHTAMDDSPRGPALDALTLDTLLTPVPARARAGSSSTPQVSGCSAPAPAPVDEAATLNPIEVSAWRAPHEERVLAAASSGPAHGRRPSRHRLRRFPRHRRRPLQGRRQRPGAGDWHGRESLAARLRPGPRRVVSAAGRQHDGVRRVTTPTTNATSR